MVYLGKVVRNRDGQYGVVVDEWPELDGPSEVGRSVVIVWEPLRERRRTQHIMPPAPEIVVVD